MNTININEYAGTPTQLSRDALYSSKVLVSNVFAPNAIEAKASINQILSKGNKVVLPWKLAPLKASSQRWCFALRLVPAQHQTH